MAQPPRFLIVIGPSGVGKSSVIRNLHQRQLAFVRPTWTTRLPRGEELDSALEHRFVTDARFDEALGAGLFCQTGAIAGLPHRYGLPAFVPCQDGAPDTVILRAPYVERLRRLIPGAVVYHISDRPDRVAQRLRARGRPGSELGPRIRDNIAESIAGDQVAQRTFVNEGTLEQLVDTVAEAMATDFSGRLGAAMTPVPL